MGHRSPHMAKSAASTSRGTRRTRSGAGRHNLSRASLKSLYARIRICLGCNRSFKSRGPWNRFCGRCRERDVEHENTKTYRVPKEWPGPLPGGPDGL